MISRQRRLARARRPEEDDRRNAVRLDGAAQQLARPEDVLLPGILLQRARAHPLGERGIRAGLARRGRRLSAAFRGAGRRPPPPARKKDRSSPATYRSAHLSSCPFRDCSRKPRRSTPPSHPRHALLHHPRPDRFLRCHPEWSGTPPSSRKPLAGALVLLHVSEPEPDFVGFDPGPQSVRVSVAKDFRTEHHQLDEYKHTLAASGLESIALHIQGPLAEKILSEARQQDAEPHRHRQPRPRRAVPSPRRQRHPAVLKGAPCPVLVVRRAHRRP